MPVSAIVPTRNRAISLARTLKSLTEQGHLPAELIVIDGSTDLASREMVERFAQGWPLNFSVKWESASQLGAAAQRNQGFAVSTQPVIWFFDDDILFERECVSRLWLAFQSNAKLGGVNAMIVSQCYQSPGSVSRMLFTLLAGRREVSFAGRVIGPAVNLLPEDRDALPEIVPVEWLNTTCTMYRREALPSPPFDSVFTGYSLGEDLALSLRVGKKWKLANARTARIFHDSQPGAHKADVSAMAEMELVNRDYLMAEIMNKCGVADYVRLFLFEVFSLVSTLGTLSGWKELPRVLAGKMKAVIAIARK